MDINLSERIQYIFKLNYPDAKPIRRIKAEIYGFGGKAKAESVVYKLKYLDINSAPKLKYTNLYIVVNNIKGMPASFIISAAMMPTSGVKIVRRDRIIIDGHETEIECGANITNDLKIIECGCLCQNYGLNPIEGENNYDIVNIPTIEEYAKSIGKQLDSYMMEVFMQLNPLPLPAGTPMEEQVHAGWEAYYKEHIIK